MLKYVSNMIRYAIWAVMAVLINYCSIALPPITITGTKTAMEKQIIGEQTELEEDVWMISSAKATTEVKLADADAKEESLKEENALTFHAFTVLDAFSDELADLKSDGVVGENSEGKLQSLLSVSSVVIPDEMREKYNPAYEKDRLKGRPYRTLLSTIEQVNIARNELIEGYIVSEKRINPNYAPDKKELFRMQKDRYHNSSKKGEFLQQPDGSWTQKE